MGWATGAWATGAWYGTAWFGGSDSGTAITNSNATQPTGNSYNVCQISGHRAKPGELVERWDGLLVLPRFSEPRSEQDFVRVHAEKLDGSIRPEPAQDNFITTDIDPSDLYNLWLHQ